MDNVVFIVINITAIILSPILAVVITQRLQNRAKRREDKLNVFKTLMANRSFGWVGRDSVYALNIVDIVFSDSKKVREQWALYYEYMGRPADSISMHTINIKRTELLEAMADDLGYKGKITWVTVQNSYAPKGYTDYLDSEARIYEAQTKIAQLVDIAIKMFSSPTLGKDIIRGFLNDIGSVIGEFFNGSFANNSDVTSEETASQDADAKNVSEPNAD